MSENNDYKFVLNVKDLREDNEKIVFKQNYKSNSDVNFPIRISENMKDATYISIIQVLEKAILNIYVYEDVEVLQRKFMIEINSKETKNAESRLER